MSQIQLAHFSKRYILFYAWQFSSFTFHQSSDITRVRHCFFFFKYVFLVKDVMTIIHLEVTFTSLKISFHHTFILYFVLFCFFYHKNRNKTKIFWLKIKITFDIIFQTCNESTHKETQPTVSQIVSQPQILQQVPCHHEIYRVDCLKKRNLKKMQ